MQIRMIVMTEWKDCKISDIGTVVGGATPSTKVVENYDGGIIPWITPKDLSNFGGRYISKGERNITQRGLDSCSAQMMPKNTVLFSSRAPIGYIAIANQPICTNQGFKSVVPNEKIDPLFLYYLLQYNKERIESMGSGTTFKEVSGNVMKNIPIKIPVSKQEQQKIASVLGLLDDKIELNNAINDNLADLLQTIYQEQFGDVSSASVQGNLSDLCLYSRDRVSVSLLNTSTYFSTENMLPGKAGATEATSLPTTPQTIACHKGDTLISNIRPYFKKIVYCENECGCSTDVLCFTPTQSQYATYLFSTLYADKFFDFMVAGSKGTKMPRGDKQQIMSYPVVLPSDEELGKFNDLALPILTQIHSNRSENKQLSAVRDALLPQLMSGKIDVSNIQL